MELRRQYDYFDTIDGTQGLIYTIGENGRRTERGEIVTMSLSVSRSVETINSLGQDTAGKKPGLPEFTASITYRIGQDQSQWARLIISPPRGQQRRRRVERFQIVAFMHDREVPHAQTQKVICNKCWVSDGTIPLGEVDTRVLTGTATIQMESVDFMEWFAPLENGITVPAPQPLILG
ncbi:MAG: hypothetical protein FWG65_13230 [Turicibacter sp.]|nr:hypothetical protein [Turicibacter sp.]